MDRSEIEARWERLSRALRGAEGRAEVHPYYVDRPGEDMGRIIGSGLVLHPRRWHSVAGIRGVGKREEMRRAMKELRERAPQVATAWVLLPWMETYSAECSSEWLLGQIVRELYDVLRPRLPSTLAERVLGVLYDKREPDSRARHMDVLRQMADPCSDGCVVYVEHVTKTVRDTQTLERALLEVGPELVACGFGLMTALPYGMAVGGESLGEKRPWEPSYWVWPEDPSDPRERAHLCAMLRKRDPEELMSEEVIERIVDASGGVARRLFSLVAYAAHEARTKGEARMNPGTVEVAIRRYRAWLHAPLTRAEIAQLRDFERAPEAVTLGEAWLDHLEAGRIVQDRSGATRLHPLFQRIHGAIVEVENGVARG